MNTIKGKIAGGAVGVLFATGIAASVGTPPALASCDETLGSLTKLDESGAPLAGAVFKVNSSPGHILVAPDRQAAYSAAVRGIPATGETAAYAAAWIAAVTEAGFSTEMTVTSGSNPVDLWAVDLPAGDIPDRCHAALTVQEVAAPEGYVLDPTPQVGQTAAGVTSGPHFTFVNVKAAPAPVPTPAPTPVPVQPVQVTIQSDLD